MRPIPDSFDSPTGSWGDYWTPDGVADSAWIDEVTHADLRSFINLDIERPRTQSELDQYSQTVLELDPPLGTQSNLESYRVVAGEFWDFAGTGIYLSGVNEPTVGLIASPANLRAITMTCDGAALDATLTSSIAVDTDETTAGVDCSEGAFGVSPYVVLSFANSDVDLATLTLADCYIQLSSNVDGSFSSGASTATGDETDYESLKVPFTGLVTGQMLAVPMASLTRDTFDPTTVTGVRIHLEQAAPTDTNQIQLLHGVRIVADPTTYAANDRKIDFDTRHHVLKNQVALDGATIGTDIPKLVRSASDDTDNDPRFVDGAVGVFFCTGGGLVQAGTNTIDLIFREGTYDAVPSHMVARISWDLNGAASYQVFRRDNNTTDEGDTTLTSWGITLDRAVDEDVAAGRGIAMDSGRYYFSATCIGSSVELRLHESSGSNAIGDLIAQVLLPNPVYKARLGRCGFTAAFTDYDAYIDEFAQGETGYGTIRSRVFSSPTPVDGVQIIANTTPDAPLTQGVFWVDSREKYVDMLKSPSGAGSYRTKTGLVTSNFLIDDWKHSYIRADIWVGPNSTVDTQPYIVIESTSLDEAGDPIKFRINLEPLQPLQWNEVYIDLLPYRNQYAGLFYRMSILVPQDGGLGNFWVDGLRLARRTVEWEARATSDGRWRSFRNYVNDPFGGIHFPPEERGRELQIQGTALTPDAKIVNYKVIPRYAQLGAPLYDKSYRTR